MNLTLCEEGDTVFEFQGFVCDFNITIHTRTKETVCSGFHKRT